VGVVEEVGVEGKKAFNNLDELCSILNPGGKEPAESKTGTRDGRQRFVRIKELIGTTVRRGITLQGRASGHLLGKGIIFVFLSR